MLLRQRIRYEAITEVRLFSPRMSVGGGLLCACLLLWVFFAGRSGVRLVDGAVGAGR